MNKILILVEGQTEELFVKNIIRPHLLSFDIFMIPVILKSKRVLNGPDCKGGILPYPRVRKQILELLNDSESSMVTTMFDYYALDRRFPGMDTIDNLETVSRYDRIEHLETHLQTDIDNQRFYPYLMLHEFESLLFSSPEQIVKTTMDESAEGYQKALQELVGVLNHFRNPEEINDNRDTCPNRRISKVIPDYNKDIYGNLIAMDIGLERMRTKCRHFGEWLERIEATG